jgi:hypothetical protein
MLYPRVIESSEVARLGRLRMQRICFHIPFNVGIIIGEKTEGQSSVRGKQICLQISTYGVIYFCIIISEKEYTYVSLRTCLIINILQYTFVA